MLTKLTNTLLILVCLAVIGQIVYSHVAPRQAPPQQRAAGAKVGDVLGALGLQRDVAPMIMWRK